MDAKMKRNVDTGSHKENKKKKKIEVDMECFSEVSERVAPFVGYFPSGYDPRKYKETEGEEGGEENPKVRAYRSKKFPNRMELAVTPKEATVDFVGTNYSGEAAATSQVCTYALGVLDKETQTLKIVPIAGNKIIRLDPKPRNRPESSEHLDEEDAPTGHYTEFANLSKLYGTKKQRNWAKKIEDRRHRDAPETQADIESKLGELHFRKETFENTVGYGEHHIPPHDVNATSPEHAYPLDGIIHEGEWDYLFDIWKLLQSTSVATLSSTFWEDNGYPAFVCKRVHKLIQIQDEDEKQKLACIFSYISYLIKFRNLHSNLQKQWPGAKRDSEKFNEIPVILFKKFVKMFVDPETIKLSPEKADLIISYVLVLTLIADGFDTETTDIAKDLHIARVELRPHFVKLGCKIKTVKKSHRVTLPVPLKLPEMRLIRRQRR